MMEEKIEEVEAKDVTVFEERMVKPNSRPNYIGFELDHEEATLNDPQKEDGDETDIVESDKEMNVRESLGEKHKR